MGVNEILRRGIYEIKMVETRRFFLQFRFGITLLQLKRKEWYNFFLSFFLPSFFCLPFKGWNFISRKSYLPAISRFLFFFFFFHFICIFLFITVYFCTFNFIVFYFVISFSVHASYFCLFCMLLYIPRCFIWFFCNLFSHFLFRCIFHIIVYFVLTLYYFVTSAHIVITLLRNSK